MEFSKRILSWILAICTLISLAAPAIPVHAAGSVDYDFHAARKLNGGSIKDLEAKSDWIRQQYDAGKLNWYFYAIHNTRDNSPSLIRNDYAMRISCNIDSWAAIAFQSPGSGSYTLQLTHSLYPYGAEVALAYILPMPDASVKDKTAYINQAIAENSATGVLDFYHEGSVSIDTQLSTLGSYNFQAGKEYILVLEATEGCNSTGTAAYMLFSKITAVAGTEAAEQKNTDISPVDLGPMIGDLGMRTQVAICQVRGYDYYFLPIKGGKMLIYNLDYYCDGKSSTNPKVGEITTGISNAWGCSAGKDGNVYVTGDARYVYRYNPVTGVGEKLTYSSVYTNGFDVSADAYGNILFGANGSSTRDNTGPVRYDASTGVFTTYYNLDPKGVATDCSAVTEDETHIYAYMEGAKNGVSTHSIFKINKATKAVEKELDVTTQMEGAGHLVALNLIDGVLIGGCATLKNMIAVDVASWKLIDIGVSSGCNGEVSQIRNGKAYFIATDIGLCEYDIATRKAAYLVYTGMSLNTHQNTFVTVDINGDGKDEDLLFTCRPAKDGYPVFYDTATKKVYNWPDLICDEAGSYLPIRNVYPSNDGSGRIFAGGYTSSNCGVYYTDTEKTSGYVTAGQTDSQLMYKDVLYAGNYATCTLAKIDPVSKSYTELMSLSDYKQKRIHCLEAGEDKIFFSSIPDTYDLGGYLAWYDLMNASTYSVKVSDIAPELKDQTIISMAYSNGLLYCGTSVNGGSDATPSQTASNFFVYDVSDRKLVARHHIAYPYVASLHTADDGTVWGVISETLFTVSYSSATGIVFTEKLSMEDGTPLTDKERKNMAGSTQAWFCRPMYFGDDGNLYTAIGYGDGVWRIELDDSRNVTGYTQLSSDAGIRYALGEDGNLYYADGNNLFLIPLNLSSADKTAAAAVNEKIKAALTSNMLSNGAAIQAAVDAFNRLSNVQKSLAEQPALSTAQRKHAIALINGLPQTLTLGNAAAVKEARSIYDSLSEAQQNRFPNYAALEEAEIQIRKLQAAADSSQNTGNSGQTGNQGTESTRPTEPTTGPSDPTSPSQPDDTQPPETTEPSQGDDAPNPTDPTSPNQPDDTHPPETTVPSQGDDASDSTDPTPPNQPDDTQPPETTAPSQEDDAPDPTDPTESTPSTTTPDTQVPTSGFDEPGTAPTSGGDSDHQSDPIALPPWVIVLIAVSFLMIALVSAVLSAPGLRKKLLTFLRTKILRKQ